MKVASVDQGHTYWHAVEGLCRIEPAKSSTDNHYMVFLIHSKSLEFILSRPRFKARKHTPRRRAEGSEVSSNKQEIYVQLKRNSEMWHKPYSTNPRATAVVPALVRNAGLPHKRWTPLRLWITTGLAVGLALTFVVSRSLKSLLYEVQPLDMTALVVGVLALCGAGIPAVLLPVWRVTRVDPLVALRFD